MITDEQLAARAAAGDELAFRQLLDRFRWIPGLVRMVFAAGLERQDFEQEARIAVLEAARAFDPEQGEFGAFAYFVVKRRLTDALKYARRQKHLLLSDAVSFELDVGDGLTLGDSFPAFRSDPVEILAAREEFAAFVRVLSHELSPLERDIATGWLDGGTMDELQERFGRETRTTWPDGRPRAKTVENALQRVRVKLDVALRDAA